MRSLLWCLPGVEGEELVVVFTWSRGRGVCCGVYLE